MAARLKELVLGGEGLIGRELGKQLLSGGSEVRSLDITNGHDLRIIGNEIYQTYDRVWFLAWDTGGAKYHSAQNRQHEMYAHNSLLSARIFDALATTKKPFLFVTSQLAGQETAYGMTKLIAEKWAQHLGGKVARLWNTYGWEAPDIRSHVVTDLVLSGLAGKKVRTMTTGKERRRFIYKADCASQLISFFDSDLQTTDIAGDRWITISELAFEIASQLNVDCQLGEANGEEVMLDPLNLYPWKQPLTSLQAGIGLVINEARFYSDSHRNV